MQFEEAITQRLDAMSQSSDPDDSLWPENCAGSRKALVIFIGPSPGGKKAEQRREIETDCYKPLWNVPYNDPIINWRSFKVSFKPIVEEIIGKPYGEAAKLIARFNMDWLGNPDSQDVSFRYMWEGCSYILPFIYGCNPYLIIPMDEKTFNILRIALYKDDYEIIPAKKGEIKIKIFEKNNKGRYHYGLMAFTAKKEEKSFIVIKSWQHPARVYDVGYAERLGKSIRFAVEKIAKDDIVNINF